MFGFLRQPFLLAMSLLLIGQAALFYAYPKSEVLPEFLPLNQVPTSIGRWQMIREIPMETEVQELLRADDSLNRYYLSPEGASVSIFIALFRSQRSGVSPHSPKVCLPGSGWTPSESRQIRVRLPGRLQEEPINRYIVSKGDQRTLVLYWYQSAHRIIADEYMAKIFTVLDGVRYRRSDTSLVRVIVPVTEGDGETAQRMAIRFLEETYPGLVAYLPH